MSNCALSIHDLNISAGDKRILSHVDFELSERSVTAVMGPMGGGKSTFLKFVSGRIAETDLVANCGSAIYNGARLGVNGYPRYIRQKTRETSRSDLESQVLLMQRLDEVDKACTGNNDVLCIDEPTAGLKSEDGLVLMRYLREKAETRSVLMVTHNKDEVSQYCDRVALFGGGRLLEHVTKDAFIHAAPDSLAGHFLRTNGLSVPHVDTPTNLLAPEHRVLPNDIDTQPMEYEFTGSWIVRSQLELRSIQLDDRGNLSNGQVTGDGQQVFNILRRGVACIDQSGLNEEVQWQSDYMRPDQDKALIARICRQIDDKVKNGVMVTINPIENPIGAAAIIGSFMVMRGTSPEEAFNLTKAKVPQLYLGMRMEQLFWDMDIEFSS